MAHSDLIQWSNTFSVGITIIDEQHKDLIKLTNDMFNHCVGDDAAERDYFKEVIQKAVDYVKIHFSTEEKIMIKTKYPGYYEHKKQHEAFIISILENIKSYEEGKKLTLVGFTRFLKDWILSHIAYTDKLYIDHFRMVAARKSQTKA